MDNGSLNDENMIKYLNVALVETPEMVPVVADNFRNCYANTEGFRRHLEPSSDGYCSAEASIIMNCVYMETYMSCTGSAWANTDECNDEREYINKCSPK